MPILTPYRLTFASGLHLGTRGVNVAEAGVHIPSDTLFAGLLDAWRRTGGDPQALAGPFTTVPVQPPFLLTSAFPYAGDVRFYPVPVDLACLLSPAVIADRGKSIKRIHFLSEALVQNMLAGERLDGWLYPEHVYWEPETGVALQDGLFWLTVAEIAGLPKAMQRDRGRRHALRELRVFASGLTPRVTIDRVSSASTIFHSGRTTFAPGCGLWFGVAWLRPADAVDGAQATYRQAFAAALGLLADDGLGGERSTGYGAFSYAEAAAPAALPNPAPGRRGWLLSRYHPTSSELPAALDDPGAAYRLTAVGGWLLSPDVVAQRRKRLYLVEEGSLVCPPAWPAGDVTDVRPEYDGAQGVPHPVWRYGLALAADLPDTQEGHHA